MIAGKKDLLGLRCRGFTLIEVVLAIGVLSLAIIAMLGMFAPTMTSVRESVNTNQAIFMADDVISYFDTLTFQEVEELIGPEEDPGIRYLIPYSQSKLNSTVAGRRVESMIIENPLEVKRLADDPNGIEGSVFRVEIKQMTDAEGEPYSVYKDSKNASYLPIFVELYAVDFLNPERTRGRQTPETPVFTFPTVKLR